MVDGRILPVVWYQGSVTSTVYLEQVTKGTVWPAVKGVATRRGYWYQQDGASSHVTEEYLQFLKAKFGDRVISRRTENHWPPYSPDLSPLDFSFWSQAMAHLLRCQPPTLQQLKGIVEDFPVNMDEDDVDSARKKKSRALFVFFQSNIELNVTYFGFSFLLSFLKHGITFGSGENENVHAQWLNT